MQDIQQELYFTPALPCMACNDEQTNSGAAFTAESQGMLDPWFNGTWVLFPICDHTECQAKLRELIRALQVKVDQKREHESG